MGDKTDVWQGTLALMVLRTLETMGPQHGYGLARRIEQTSGDLLQLNYGTLYPALLKLEQEGYIRSHWGTSENNRKAKFYELTKAGQRQVRKAAAEWEQTTEILATFLDQPRGHDAKTASTVVAADRAAAREDEADGEFSAEIEAHLACDIEDGVRSGLSESEARRQALIRLGGAEQARQAYRERTGLPWLDSLQRDLRYSVRTLAKHKGVTAVAVLSIGLGIGANATIFSMVNRLVLRPAPVGDPATLLSTAYQLKRRAVLQLVSTSRSIRIYAITRIRFPAWQRSMNCFRPRSAAAENRERVWGQGVTTNFFDVLELPMVAGPRVYERR